METQDVQSNDDLKSQQEQEIETVLNSIRNKIKQRYANMTSYHPNDKANSKRVIQLINNQQGKIPKMMS